MILRTLSSKQGGSEVVLEEMVSQEGIVGIVVWVETPRGTTNFSVSKQAALMLGRALLEEGEKLP